MGTERESFIELTERIGRKTGGVSVSPSVMSKKGSDEPVAFITVRAPLCCRCLGAGWLPWLELAARCRCAPSHRRCCCSL